MKKISTSISYKIFGVIIAICLLISAQKLRAQTEKIRLIVMTDISNEPDDQQSLTRLLLYANEFDIEGIIATTSCWKQSNPDIASINGVIDAYAKVYSNLLLHDVNYPTAAYLKSISKSGVNGYGMSAAASNLNNEGINHIISVIDKNDPRPVWVISWGGSNTLGGAVMKVKNTRSEAEAKAFVEKIRGYEIAIQDDGQAYISHNFPDAFLIASKLQFKGMSKTTPTFNAWPESWGGNNDVLNASWVAANIQNNHGALGQKYPNAVYLFEGDTPSLLYLIPNGLGSPENPNYGSWGGRFGSTKTLNVLTGTGNSSVDPKLNKYKNYAFFTDSGDTWQYNGINYENNIYAPVFRWREAYQYDMAARIDWCIKPYTDANHPPVVLFEGSLMQDVAINTTIHLSAKGSTDPDGNTLSYHWIYYKEAGNCSDNIVIANADSLNASFTVPSVSQPTTFQVILSVTDNGSPALTRYKRIIFNTLCNTNIEGISINSDSLSMMVGDKTLLPSTITPIEACSPIVYWSSDSNVATINSKGIITAVGSGSAKIIASNIDKTVTDSLFISVSLANSISSIANDNQFRIYPNPLQGSQLNITNMSQGQNVISIFGISGQLVNSVKTNMEAYTFENLQLIPGIYIVNVKADSQSRNTKLIVK